MTCAFCRRDKCRTFAAIGCFVCPACLRSMGVGQLAGVWPKYLDGRLWRERGHRMPKMEGVK